MLDSCVSELELGAVLLAYRLKGESSDELAAMLCAAHRSFEPLHVQAGREHARPVSIPSYNGARKTPNLVPLLSLLLAREGVPVLVHGVTEDPGGVTSAELAPKLARMLALRRRMGVRNSTHTLVKILSRSRSRGSGSSTTRTPSIARVFTGLFTAHPDAASGSALLARGTKGEAVADTRRQVQADWFHDDRVETLISPEHSQPHAPHVELPEALDAATTARWMESVLRGDVPVPTAVARQVEVIANVVRKPLDNQPNPI